MTTMGAGLAYTAVGIPHGIFRDHETGEVAGAVRRGGEIVSLDAAEYALWAALLTPMTVDAALEAVSPRSRERLSQAIARLGELALLVPIDPGKPMGRALERLRPLPLGVGLGNCGDGPARFEIQNATLSLPSPVSLDPVAVMFWWEFDGTKSLAEIVPDVIARVPGLPGDRSGAIVAELIHGLMASRLLYLDGPAPAGSE